MRPSSAAVAIAALLVAAAAVGSQEAGAGGELPPRAPAVLVSAPADFEPARLASDVHAASGRTERTALVTVAIGAPDVDPAAAPLPLGDPALASTVHADPAAAAQRPPRIPRLDGLSLDAGLADSAIDAWYSHAEPDVLVRFQFRLQRLGEALASPILQKLLAAQRVDVAGAAADLAVVERRLASLPALLWPLEDLASRHSDAAQDLEARYASRGAEALFVEAWRLKRARETELTRAFDEQFAAGRYTVVSASAAVG